MERALLYGYWAVSGYGLRAWRAATTLAVVHVASAGLYTLPAFATVTQPAAQIEVVDLTSGAVTLHRPLPPPEALCGRAILTMTSRSAGASAILAQIRSPVSRAVQSAPVSSLRYGGVDDRLVLWVAQAQRDRASALWPQQDRSERDRVSSMRISDTVSSTAGSRR